DWRLDRSGPLTIFLRSGKLSTNPVVKAGAIMRSRMYVALAATCSVIGATALVQSAGAAQASPAPSWQISAILPGPGGLATLYQVAAVRGDVWSASQGGHATYGPQSEEWNGKSWQDRTPPGLTTGQIAAIAMSAPNNVWAAAGD